MRENISIGCSEFGSFRIQFFGYQLKKLQFQFIGRISCRRGDGACDLASARCRAVRKKGIPDTYRNIFGLQTKLFGHYLGQNRLGACSDILNPRSDLNAAVAEGLDFGGRIEVDILGPERLSHTQTFFDRSLV